MSHVQHKQNGVNLLSDGSFEWNGDIYALSTGFCGFKVNGAKLYKQPGYESDVFFVSDNSYSVCRYSHEGWHEAPHGDERAGEGFILPNKRQRPAKKNKGKKLWVEIDDSSNPLADLVQLRSDGFAVLGGREIDQDSWFAAISLANNWRACRHESAEILLEHPNGNRERFRYRTSRRLWERYVQLFKVDMDEKHGSRVYCSDGRIVFESAKPKAFVIRRDEPFQIFFSETKRACRSNGKNAPVLVYDKDAFHEYQFAKGRWFKVVGEYDDQTYWSWHPVEFRGSFSEQIMGGVRLYSDGECEVANVKYDDGEGFEFSEGGQNAYRRQGLGEWIYISGPGGVEGYFLQDGIWNRAVPTSRYSSRTSLWKYLRDHGLVMGIGEWLLSLLRFKFHWIGRGIFLFGREISNLFMLVSALMMLGIIAVVFVLAIQGCFGL